MKYFDWNDEKNVWLIQERGISFELCTQYILSKNLLAIVDNHHPYSHQQVFIINIEGYCFEVPFVEDEEKIFLKTAYPSHEATKNI